MRNQRENRRRDMFGRVAIFAKDNASDFKPDSKTMKCVSRLEEIRAALDLAAANQQSADATVKEVLLDSLRMDMQGITRTAAAIGQEEPGFEVKFPPPPDSNPRTLEAAADAFILKLKEPGIAHKFIEFEMPADFVENLAADRQAIRNAKTEQDRNSAQGIASTAAIGRLIGEGLQQVKQIDAAMRNKYKEDSVKLLAWRKASHTERTPRRFKKTSNGEMTDSSNTKSKTATT